MTHPHLEPPEPADHDEPARPAAVGPAAAYARNWRTVLAVDAGMGVVLLLAGVVLAVVWNPVAGGFMGSLGLVYVVLVARRARAWRQLRRDAGL
jgi:hypothetical protein